MLKMQLKRRLYVLIYNTHKTSTTRHIFNYISDSTKPPRDDPKTFLGYRDVLGMPLGYPSEVCAV